MAALLLPAALEPGVALAQWRQGGVPVCTAASNQFTPATIPDGAGGVILAWYDHRSGAFDIYAQRLRASGEPDPAWPANGRAVCTAANGQFSPRVVEDGAGGALIVWHDERSGSNFDLYAHRIRPDGTLDPGWPSQGLAVCTASDDQVYPAVAADQTGGWVAAWRDLRGGPDSNVYAQRLQASGVVDPAWPANGRAICTATGNQSTPTIAADGAGGVYIAWSDLRGSSSDIYLHHLLASGSPDPAWPTDGQLVCGADGNQSEPDLISDGAGGVLVAWSDYRNDLDSDIYVQRMLVTGLQSPGWPAGGRLLCAATGDQYTPLLASDGAGGALIAWYDYRGGPEADVYAGRVLATGQVDPDWPAGGRALCVAPGEQVTPRILADGAGGALVAWPDARGGSSSDVYVQRVHADGQVDPDWPEDGLGVCTAVGEQFTVALTTDGAGGGIVAWSDFRGGSFSDLYALRVEAGGHVTAVGSGPGRGGPGLSIHPSPARGGVRAIVELARDDRGSLAILDPAGRQVAVLASDRELIRGRHEFKWDGRGAAGRPATPGVYWVRLATSRGVTARKLVLLAP